jgi:hypothetical protein
MRMASPFTYFMPDPMAVMGGLYDILQNFLGEPPIFSRGACDIVPFLIIARSLQAFIDSEDYPVR